VVGVDREVSGVDVVSLEDHLQNFRLMHGTFLHQVQNLVLLSNRVVDVVVQLELHLVLKLSVLLQRGFLLHWVSKVLVIFGQ